MKKIIVGLWMTCAASLVAGIFLLEYSYESIQYRLCIYDALNKKPMSKDCKELLKSRRK